MRKEIKLIVISVIILALWIVLILWRSPGCFDSFESTLCPTDPFKSILLLPISLAFFVVDRILGGVGSYNNFLPRIILAALILTLLIYVFLKLLLKAITSLKKASR